jgi:hypothetical protein
MVWVCNLMCAFVNFAIVAFLFERIHVVRAPFVRHLEDRIYLAYLVTIFVSLKPVAIENYVNTKASMSSDGRCYFGVKGNVTIYALVINMFIDLALTGVFFYLLRPSINIHGLPTVSRALQNTRGGNNPLVEDEKKRTPVYRNIGTLLWKSIVGSLAIDLPIVDNISQLVAQHNRERSMICIIICVVEGELV